MKFIFYSVPLLIFLLIFVSIFSQKKDQAILNEYKINSESNKIIFLPKMLKEVSGLAFGGSDILYMHNDEEGIVYKFDMNKKKVVKEYELGEKHIKKDFEDIAAINDSIYLISSHGILYKFSLEDGHKEIPFQKIITGLNKKNNIEGLCYNPKTNSFLLACKGFPGKGYEGYRAVYEFSLKNNKLKSKPLFLISLEQLKDEYNIKDFAPSGIELHKESGHFFLISAAPEVIIELDSQGILVNAKKFNDKIHKQPEGITFLNDGTLVISDEGKNHKGKLTIIKKND